MQSEGMADAGNGFVTSMLQSIRSVSSAMSVEYLWKPRRSTINFR